MLALSTIWIVAAATFVVSHYARRGSASLRLGIAAVACAVISALLIPIVGAPWHPIFQSTDGTLITPQRISVAIWWLSAARLILLSGRISYERRTDASRLVFDLASGAVHLGVIIIILSLAFGVFVPGLIATSGVIAVVIGLALQNTLGDLFSGIAISIERPFSTGDYIWIEGAMEGVVLETNWRATRIMTDTQDIATVPNSVVAKARILNRSLPTEVRAESVRLVLEPGVLPHRGLELFNAATLTLGDSPAHSWSVICSDLRGEGTFYEIRFSAPRRSLSAVRSSFLQQVARHARYAGIAFGPQSGTPPRAVQAPDAAHLLMETGLFHGLKEAELKLLEQKAIIRRGGEGEVLIHEGATDTSLLVIAQGVLEVSLDTGTGPVRLHSVAPGDYVGELTIMTDVANPTTVKALTPYLAYEVTKADLAALLQDNPAVLDAFRVGTDKTKTMLALASKAQERVEEISTDFLQRVKAYLPF